MELSVCIITKNEERSLQKCLECLKNRDVEIVVVDTGSTDRTREIACTYTKSIYDFVWCDDFSKAKNYAVEKAAYDQVMVIDSDEYVTFFDEKELEKLIHQNPNKVGRIERINELEQNGNKMFSKERVNRIFDRRKFCYEGCIHEQLVRRDHKTYETYLVPVSADHDGYLLSEEKQEQKALRNISLLEKELQQKEDPYILYQLGKSYYLKKDYVKACDYLDRTLSFDLDPKLEYVIDAVETYGYALLNSGQANMALNLEGVADTFGGTSDFQFLMGLIYMNNEKFDHAEQAFLQAVKWKKANMQGADSYLAYYNAGVIRECLGDVDKAMEYYLKCGQYPPAVKQIGAYLEKKNLDQAYLVYQQKKYEAADGIFYDQINELSHRVDRKIPKTAIVILSYNNLNDTRNCIESIRRNCNPSDYEIVVVDNASQDGCVEWLREQHDIKLLCNTENKGFPGGCNQGIELADSDSDIWLLNSDTLVPKESLFWLRMGLYESERTAAVGSMSNHCPNYQNIAESDVTPDNYEQYVENQKHSLAFPYEKKVWLVGFSVLIRRTVLERTGYLDEIFTPGNFEDTDLGYRIVKLGYQQLLCKNSFIYHHGSRSFGKKRERFYQLLDTNEQKFINKWKFHPSRYSYIEKECLALMQDHTRDEKFRMLQLDCGTGATLARLQYLYPNAEIIGIDRNEKAVELANCVSNARTVCNYEKLEEMQLHPYAYVLAAGVWEMQREPEKLLIEIKNLLADGGYLVGKITNSKCLCFEKEEGKMYYTAEQWVDQLVETGYEVIEFSYQKAKQNLSEGYKVSNADRLELEVLEYFFKARVK